MSHHILRARCLFCLGLTVALLAGLLGCGMGETEDPVPPISPERQASLAILTDQLGLDEISAMDILSQLYRAGYTESIRMAFVREDEQGGVYYRLWLESAALDVTLDADGLVTRIQNGTTIHLAVSPQTPSTDAPGNEGSTLSPSVENSVENTDNPVENGEKPVENTGDSVNEPDTPPPMPDLPQQDLPDEPQKMTLQLISLTTPIAAGSKATLQARGVPGEAYEISVRYASGESEAQGLEPQTADAQGNLLWTFRVASRVAPGEYPVTVKGAGETLVLTLTVTAP